LAAVVLALAGCIGTAVEGPNLAALDAELTVHGERGPCPIPGPLAQDSGLAEAASDAIAEIHGVHQRAFANGQIPAILNESRYVHVAFPANATLELPSYEAVDERRFANLYLLWEDPAGIDDVLSDGGMYGSTYEMSRLADAARRAADQACGPSAA
jgi:hypothetical protein